jgi:hypothetical protein
MLRTTARGSTIPYSAQLRALPSGSKISVSDHAHLVLERLPLGSIRHHARRFVGQSVRTNTPMRSYQVFDTRFEPVEADPSRPPTLYVVIDTEAEFDWGKPFARNLAGVTSMDDIERGQEIFDHYGLRPIYVVDFPVASQDRSVNRLRPLLERRACYIGAHLHPWTTPPFEEQLSLWNSFPGNLPPALEEQKLSRLIEAISTNFGIVPRFYKAGRYGFGRATAATLARHGLIVDLSVLPGADLRLTGGPDFRDLQPIPYWVGNRDILTMPMTRSHVGVAPSLGRLTEAMRRAPSLSWLRLQSPLSRLRIVDTLTLTPEGITAREQIRLINAMIKRGNRLLVMHYHSPSLSPGHTPYVRSAADSKAFTDRIRDVLHYFFDEVGGMPGYPPDLLRLGRGGIWGEAA